MLAHRPWQISLASGGSEAGSFGRRTARNRGRVLAGGGNPRIEGFLVVIGNRRERRRILKRMNLFVSLALSASLLGGVASAQDAVRPVPARTLADPTHRSVPMCTADQMSLATDGENGSFDGMSHSGTLVVLRNLGSAACKLDPFPQITFLDGSMVLEAKGTVAGAQFMHPGPVVFPVVVAPGAELTSPLRWVSGEVYSKNVCINPKAISVRIGQGKQQAAFQAHLCGEQGKGIQYEMGRFATDPVYTSK